ncbi:MAG: hypothetical protein ACKOC5_06590, partial [Chloroflexota bacterium]
RGGTVVNRVPHAAELAVEMRAFDPQVFEDGVQKMLALDGSSDVASQDGHPCRVQVEMIARNVPWPRNPATDRLYALFHAAGAALGLEVPVELRGGLSDGNLIWHRFPTIDGLGPCGDNAHCSERAADGSKEPEFVLISSFVPKAELCLQVIQRLLQEA